jgi:osmotically-inducible protein OsmY
VATIHEKIKADKRFDGQWRHINVSSRDRIVTVRGWVKGRVQANDLVKFARTTRCVRGVISRNLRSFFSTMGCGSGQKRCGDTCIGRNEECNLIQ